jgi:hypothetical protein
MRSMSRVSDPVASLPGLHGARAGRAELVCRVCGYGVVVAVPPTRCPMCQGSSWKLRSGARLGAAAGVVASADDAPPTQLH